MCRKLRLNLLCFFTTDTIAQRGERLELLIDKAEDLNTTVSFQKSCKFCHYRLHTVFSRDPKEGVEGIVKPIFSSILCYLFDS